jgi:enoyl-CoA hydratase/carnithine racemase
VLADTSEAMGRWANRPLKWWHRHRGVRGTTRPAAPLVPREAEAPDPVRLTVEGAVATVTLNRPQRRNALDLASWYALAGIARHLAASETVRVVVLTGRAVEAVAEDGTPAGRSRGVFSAGSDISEFPAERVGAQAARRYTEVSEAALAAWSALPQPVVAVISGYCLGAGLELALTADFRLAADDAVFGIPATKLGIGISVADARRLIAVVGAAKARGLLLSGDRLSAAQALRIGLVDDVVPAAEIPARVDRRVQALLGNAPLAMAWVKRAVDFATRHPDGEPFAFDDLGTQVFASDDCAEGVAAFLAKRTPRFRGR